MTLPTSESQIEALLERLPPAAQLKIAAGICERLSSQAGPAPVLPGAETLAQTDSWLAACDAFAERFPSPSDSAEEMRQLRAERVNRL